MATNISAAISYSFVVVVKHLVLDRSTVSLCLRLFDLVLCLHTVPQMLTSGITGITAAAAAAAVTDKGRKDDSIDDTIDEVGRNLVACRAARC